MTALPNVRVVELSRPELPLAGEKVLVEIDDHEVLATVLRVIIGEPDLVRMVRRVEVLLEHKGAVLTCRLVMPFRAERVFPTCTTRCSDCGRYDCGVWPCRCPGGTREQG